MLHMDLKHTHDIQNCNEAIPETEEKFVNKDPNESKLFNSLFRVEEVEKQEGEDEKEEDEQQEEEPEEEDEQQEDDNEDDEEEENLDDQEQPNTVTEDGEVVFTIKSKTKKKRKPGKKRIRPEDPTKPYHCTIGKCRFRYDKKWLLDSHILRGHYGN